MNIYRNTSKQKVRKLMIIDPEIKKHIVELMELYGPLKAEQFNQLLDDELRIKRSGKNGAISVRKQMVEEDIFKEVVQGKNVIVALPSQMSKISYGTGEESILLKMLIEESKKVWALLMTWQPTNDTQPREKTFGIFQRQPDYHPSEIERRCFNLYTAILSYEKERGIMIARPWDSNKIATSGSVTIEEWISFFSTFLARFNRNDIL
jgi:hypothetical protein